MEFYLSCILKIFLAFLTGVVLGLERKSRQQAVGMRTLILICESSAMLAILSSWITDRIGAADNARIAAGVISGIGFLGAGVIMKQGRNIKGLTSAAIIWACATMGLCIGSGLYVPTFVMLALSIVSLLVFERVEEKLFPAVRSKSLVLTFASLAIEMESLSAVVESFGFVIADVNVSQDFETQRIQICYSVKAPRISDYTDFVSALNKIGVLSEFSISV